MTSCPICKREIKNAAGLAMHVKKHIRAGKLKRVEIPSHNYGFRNPVIYVRTK